MDRISLLGLTLGLLAIIAGQMLEGGHIASLVQPTAFLIVCGGTLGAVMLQSPRRVFLDGMRMGRWVFVPPADRREELIASAVRWSATARREGLLALERQIALESDPFLQRGLQLLVDGVEPARLRELLSVEIDVSEAQMKLGARIWEAAGGYAPTIGILGAVLGLIQVMENLSDPSRLGAGIAVAFVATVYGVGFANLVFLPVAKKLLAHVARISSEREMLADALVAIAGGENPRLVESRMRGYMV
ncbi:MAG TPA: flagellar motor protein [Azoarcus sp.]|nr:flagellar motor protein [Azoarcus sp.]